MTAHPLLSHVSLDLRPPAGPWPTSFRYVVAIGVVAVALLVLVALYRRELRHVAPRTARLLFVLRAAAVGVVLLTLLFDPVVTRVTREEAPGRVLVAVDRSDSMRVSDPHRPLAEKLRLLRALRLAGDLYDKDELTRVADEAERVGDVPSPPGGRERLAEAVKRLDDLTRLAVAVRALGPAGADLLAELKAKHAVEVEGFDQVAEPLPADVAALADALRAGGGLPANGTPPEPSFSDLKLPLASASQSAGAVTGGPGLLGVVVLTDGRHNWGESPLPLAGRLGRQGVPVYPVLVAPTKPPPDVAVVTARPQAATVFKGSVVPVGVEVRVTGLPPGPVTVSMAVPPDGAGPPRERVTETVPHTGTDAVYRLALKAKLNAPGPQSLTVTATGHDPAADRFPGNNARAARVNVVKDRARVMLIDGEARWEFHYLHTALGRDETMDVRSVVFRQPRITAATDEQVRPLGFPAREMPAAPDALAGYDCVVVGDVEPGQFPPAERDRIEKYVADAGGTLVIVAGKRAMPLGYPDGDPFRKLLPVRDPAALDAPAGFRLALSPAADRSWFLSMADTAGGSRAAWSRFPPHYWAVVGAAKDGAEVLAEVPAGVPGRPPRGAAVIARQNYGFGRVLYVGIDSTWRWRYRVGDRFHHRFWGQVAQWAASDRLLPTANAAGTIRFGTREPAYRPGQDVELVVRATEAVRTLTPNALKWVRLIRLQDDPPGGGAGGNTNGLPPKREKEPVPTLVPLEASEARPRELTATLHDLSPGQYAVELDVPEWADRLQGPPGPDGRAEALRAQFEVLPPDAEELVELSGSRGLLEQIAAASGGKVYTPDTMHELVSVLKDRTAVREEVVSRPARRSWWTLGLFVALLAAEWGVRKWVGLP